MATLLHFRIISRVVFIITALLPAALQGMHADSAYKDLLPMVSSINPKGEIEVGKAPQEGKLAGFYIAPDANEEIQICNDKQTEIYVNGRLLAAFSVCHTIQPKGLHEAYGTDSVFVSIFSKEGLSALSVYSEDSRHKIVKESAGTPRSDQAHINAFLIVSFMLMLVLYGGFLAARKARKNYLLKKAFSLKFSAYEFVSTAFVSASNLHCLSLLAMVAGLLFTVSTMGDGTYYENISLAEGIQKWFIAAGLTFVLVGGKYVVCFVFARLFKFRKMHDHQLFDFQNLTLIMLTLVAVGFLSGYLFSPPLQHFIEAQMKYIFSFMLGGFALWFGFKFVRNSPKENLLIISYLCATELIPAVLFFVEISK